MYIIDAHQHFWKYSPQDHSWINEGMAVLKRDFLPKNLQGIYKENGVGGCIAVQADQSEAETDFLLDLADENDFIKGVVGWIDLRAENIEERLRYYSAYPKLKGFRHIVQSEPDVNFMLDGKFQHGLSCLEKYGFTYDILIFPTQMEAALQTIKIFPGIKFVIDHIAKPYIKKGESPGWEKYMREMAAHPNVYCKISGMVTEADWKNWVYEDFTPWLDVVFDAFGADRIMFGSDWPVCLLAGNYEQIKGIVDQYLEPFSEEVKAKVWGANAVDFYGI
jgi:L-fuconolactonase